MTSLTNNVTRQCGAFVLGVSLGVVGWQVVGFLGRYVVKKLMPDETREPAKGNIRVICLADGGAQIKEVTWLGSHISYDDLNVLRKSVGWKERTKPIWDEVLRTSTYVVCVKKEERLVGFGTFVGNGRMGTIFDVVVHPDHQKQKIGTRIMNTLVEQINTKEYASVCLFGWEENKGVLKFYEKFGFNLNPHAMESSSAQLTQYI